MIKTFRLTFIVKPGCTILFCIFVFGNIFAQENIYAPSAYPDRIILNVTADLSTSIAINWRTSDQVMESFAEIALLNANPGFPEKAIRKKATTAKLLNDNIHANYHSIIMDDLKPATQYAYRVGQDEKWSEWFYFKTADNKDSELSFIYFGDAQTNIKSMWSPVIRKAFSMMPDARLMIHAGDLINRANRDNEWAEWFAAGGYIHSSVVQMVTPGNHEYYENDSGIDVPSVFWRPQFNLPLNGPPTLEETCYYTDVQGVRFISLNSNAIEISDEQLLLQKKWLDTLLKNNPNRWTCISFHHPVYSTKVNRDNIRLRENFKPIFDKYKVDLVLQGHDHTYVRGMKNIPVDLKKNEQPSATMYVVSVSGPKMATEIAYKKWMDRTAAHTQMFQLIRINKDTLSYKAYTATGELYDAFELVKQKGKPNRLIDKIPPGVAERK